MEPTGRIIPFRRRGSRQRSARRAALGLLRRWRAELWARAWLAGTWLAARRRLRLRQGDIERQSIRTQTRGLGLRTTEWLRDRLRPGWLRLRSDDRAKSGDEHADGTE